MELILTVEEAEEQYETTGREFPCNDGHVTADNGD